MHKILSQKDSQLLLMQEWLFENQWFSCFHIQIQDLKLFFTCRGFRLTYHDIFFCTNDEWRHSTRGLARNCPRLCSWVSLSFQMDSFICYLFFSLALYRWFSLPPSMWCDVQSLHGLWWQICWSWTLIFFPLLVYLSLFVLYTFFLCVFVQSLIHSSVWLVINDRTNTWFKILNLNMKIENHRLEKNYPD